MPPIESARYRGVAKFQYDFAALGGAVSAITLVGKPLPIYAIVFGGVVDVITAFTGAANCSAALSVQSANDLITDAVVAGAPWSTTGLKAIVPVGDASHGIKLTAERKPTFTITVAAVTAGKFNLFLVYFLSDTTT